MSKTMRTAYITDSAYAALQELARYRALILGEKNSRGQMLGTSSLIDEAVIEYADKHMDELVKYRSVFDTTKRSFLDV